LVIAEAKLVNKGPRWIYSRIRDTISESREELPELSLDIVSVAKPDAPIVSLLMAVINTGPGIAGIRFTNNVINGTVVEDAYIYRLTRRQN
jgi:hypothetical protein